MERVQNQMAAQIDLSTQIMDQLLRDQTTLAKQLDTTGKTVSNLAQQFSATTHMSSGHPRPSPVDPFGSSEPLITHFSSDFHRSGGEHAPPPRHVLPNMSFPIFKGDNPKFGEINSWTTFTYSIYLKLYGLLVLL